jgi:NhaP-type Na+/H+ or K+/H+ antiporter
MNGYFWAFGGATVVFVAAISYAMTRRYGWGAAVAVPALALAAMIGMEWQQQKLGFADGLGLIRASLGFVAPILLAAAAGIAIARLMRK